MAFLNKPVYRQRLFLWLVAYSLLMMGCVVAYQYNREKQFKADELNAQLQIVNKYVLEALEDGDSISVGALRRQYIGDIGDLRLSIIDGDGMVVYDNALDALPAANHLDRKEIAQAMATGEAYTVRRHSSSTGDYYFYSATRGNDGTVVRTAVPYSLSLTTLLRADYTFLWFMVALTCLLCILGYFATRRLGATISRLSRFADDVEKGNPVSDTPSFPHDELGNISSHLVTLYVKLRRAMADRDREHAAVLEAGREKERIKKQLTDNINHELKTPVASISACIDILLDHPDIDDVRRHDFLLRCRANIRRLTGLMADVALITRMSEGAEAITRESTDLCALIAEVVADRSVAAAAKGIEICTAMPPSLEIDGNRNLLASIFGNLVDNAIAYSGASRISISVSAPVGSEVRIEVADNGSGVGEEHLQRIFERFYRIDKGRSRAAGGTGLGLSIVRNAVLFHNGTIEARNAVGGGLVFDIILGGVK